MFSWGFFSHSAAHGHSFADRDTGCTSSVTTLPTGWDERLAVAPNLFLIPHLTKTLYPLTFPNYTAKSKHYVL